MIAVFNAVAGILDDVTTSLEGNKSGFQRFVSDGVLLAIQSLSAFITVVDVVYRGVQALTSLIAGSLTGSLSVVAAGVGLFNDNAKQMSETLALAAKGSIEDFKSALVDDNALGVVQEALAKVETAAKASMGALRDGANEAAPAVDGAKNAVRSLTEEQVKLQEQAVKTHEELTKAALSEAEQLQAKVDQQTAAFEQGLISQAQYNADLAVLDEQFVANKQKVSDEILAQKITENDQLRQLDADLYADRIAQNNEAIASLLANEDEFSKNKIALALKTKQQQDKIDSDRNKAGMDALNALASFQTAKTKELQAIGKAAAITQATIQTYQGATGAFAALSGIPFVGPALAIAAAAAIVAAGLANVAKISGTPLATGIDSVPGTGTRDNFPAMLMPGERVVPTETNKDLTRYLAEQAGTKSLLSSINQKLSNLQSQVVVNVGGREIINEINNQLDGGRRISL
ncbi:MAG: hypothetical protein E6R04_07990 [Spirochaetes bacterium]|nr:MAG: hypothetical protein E6R04_07990 [Spirochaetota bacterium]